MPDRRSSKLPVVKCGRSSCSWDTRGEHFGAPPCEGLTRGGCLAMKLALKDDPIRSQMIRSLARSPRG